MFTMPDTNKKFKFIICSGISLVSVSALGCLLLFLFWPRVACGV